MPDTHSVTINGETFTAYRGDVLLDAALTAGVDIPHDCRAGQCRTCAVQLVEGQVYCGKTTEPGLVLACQSRIISDAEFVVEKMPPVAIHDGRITAMAQIASDVVNMRIDLNAPIRYLPGQYFRVRFKGFPERCFSATVPMDRPSSGNRSFHLHIRRLHDGRVSNAIGRRIRKGHQVTVTGPFGSAFLREKRTNRLVLVASSTGFAPIWSIATAALAENPEREMLVVVGGQTIDSLYMLRALQRLAKYPNVQVVAVCSTPQTMTRAVSHGLPTDHLRELNENDIVYVCSAAQLVDEVKHMATAAGALCYADPFVVQEDGEESLLSSALSWVTGGSHYGEAGLLSRGLSWVRGDLRDGVEGFLARALSWLRAEFRDGEEGLLARGLRWLNGEPASRRDPMEDDDEVGQFRDVPRQQQPLRREGSRQQRPLEPSGYEDDVVRFQDFRPPQQPVRREAPRPQPRPQRPLEPRDDREDAVHFPAFRPQQQPPHRDTSMPPRQAPAGAAERHEPAWAKELQMQSWASEREPQPPMPEHEPPTNLPEHHLQAYFSEYPLQAYIAEHQPQPPVTHDPRPQLASAFAPPPAPAAQIQENTQSVLADMPPEYWGAPPGFISFPFNAPQETTEPAPQPTAAFPLFETKTTNPDPQPNTAGLTLAEDETRHI